MKNMSRQLQPIVSLVKTETPTVIKNEPPESEIVEIGVNNIFDSSESEEKIIPDVKDINIVYQPVYEYSIKSEILEESKHCESVEHGAVETQVLIKAENSPFIKIENITQRNKTEGTSGENVTKVTGQAVVEVQGSNEYSNVLSNLETDTHVLHFSKDLNGISTRTRKAKEPEKTNFVKCYKTIETTSCDNDEEKIKVITAPVIPIEPHEYTSLAKDKHVCNNCLYASNRLDTLKFHIKKKHRKLTTMYQCPYCPHKSKWSVREHIIRKHKNTKDIQWFQCHLCEKKFKLKSGLTQHINVHLTHELSRKTKAEIDDRVLKYRCDECDYKHYRYESLKMHKLVHLKPEEIQYLYCYHCSHKSKRKSDLKIHIFRHHFKNVKLGKTYGCNKCDYETYKSTQLNRHKLNHLKPEDIPYFHCYHCSYKSKEKANLQRHICKHLKNGEVKFDCYICNFMTQKRESIIEHIKKHSKVQIKFEINEGS